MKNIICFMFERISINAHISGWKGRWIVLRMFLMFSFLREPRMVGVLGKYTHHVDLKKCSLSTKKWSRILENNLTHMRTLKYGVIIVLHQI